MVRKVATQTKLRACPATGCAEVIPEDQIFCERHDAMLQSDIKTILAKKYRPGKAPSKLFTLILERAVKEVLFC